MVPPGVKAPKQEVEPKVKQGIDNVFIAYLSRMSLCDKDPILC